MIYVDRPDLQVIDDAIDSISRGFVRYSCLALAYAGGTSIQNYEDSMYVDQYRAFTKQANGGMLPSWWSRTYEHCNDEAREKRVAALKAFRQACVDAGKKSKE